MTGPADFLPGDLIALASGGPAMTVRACASGWVEADWFAGPLLQSGRFRAEQLALLDFDAFGPDEPAGKPTTH